VLSGASAGALDDLADEPRPRARRLGGSQTPLFLAEADPDGGDGEGPSGVRWELIPNAG
jgi:hypothetical protein